jgi:light-regulated signal transduction histidine kinase (bacteriophytochrome)
VIDCSLASGQTSPRAPFPVIRLGLFRDSCGRLAMSDQHEPLRGAFSGLDLSLCEREPIHIPGAIQPHGALIAARADGLLVSHASANLATILGRPADSMLGRPLQDAIGEAACRILHGSLRRDGIALGKVFALPGPKGSPLHLHAHRSNQTICVDIEPRHIESGPRSPVIMAQSVLETFNQATSRAELCELAVRGLKAITRFDRVIAYRFGHDGHGEVIAEARAARLRPYLGLRYPASDIFRRRLGGNTFSIRLVQLRMPATGRCRCSRIRRSTMTRRLILRTAHCAAFHRYTASTCVI